MNKKYEDIERLEDQLNLLYNLKEALYQAQFYISVLDRRIYNWGQYVDIDHETLKTMNATLQDYKTIVRGVIDRAD